MKIIHPDIQRNHLKNNPQSTGSVGCFTGALVYSPLTVILSDPDI